MLPAVAVPKSVGTAVFTGAVSDVGDGATGPTGGDGMTGPTGGDGATGEVTGGDPGDDGFGEVALTQRWTRV